MTAVEAVKLTADLNNDPDGERAYQAALADAAATGYTGRVQGPTMWTMDGQQIAPVDVFRDGQAVDHFMLRLDG